MEQYTVGALENYITAANRDYLTWKELRELKSRFIKLAKEGPAQKITAQNHISLLDGLMEKFAGQRKISVTDLRAATDTFLRTQGYVCSMQSHAPASARHVYQETEAEIYDLAFYNSLNVDCNYIAHHKTETQRSLFYCRAEHWDQTLVWGNIQIDLPRRLTATAAPELDIILRRKNLYALMVQEAVKHALRAGKNRIIFQAGSAAAWAQWNSKIVMEKISITEENYPHYHQIYEEQCTQFENTSTGVQGMTEAVAAKNPFVPMLPPGLVDKDPVLLVYKKCPEQIIGQWILPNSGLNYTLYKYYETRALAFRPTPEKYLPVRDYIYKKLQEIHQMVLQACPEKILESVDKIFQCITTGFVSSQHQEKISYLKKLPFAQLNKQCVQMGWWAPSLPWLDEFLERFGYDKIVRATCPEITVIESPGEISGRKRFYIDKEYSGNCIIRKSDIFFPELGCQYTNAKEFMAGGKERKLSPGRHCVYAWYENILPKILTANELTVRKVSLKTLTPEHTIYGWEIISGLSKFIKRPVRIF